MLRIGNAGTEVLALRKKLAYVAADNSTALESLFQTSSPEVFDSAMDRIVRAIQTKTGIAVDGIVGPDTTAALTATLNKVPASVVNFVENQWTIRFPSKVQGAAVSVASMANNTAFVGIVGFGLLGLMYLYSKRAKPVAAMGDAQSDMLLEQVRKLAEDRKCDKAVPMFLRRTRVLPKSHMNSEIAKDAESMVLRRCGKELEQAKHDAQRYITDVEDEFRSKRSIKDVKKSSGVNIVRGQTSYKKGKRQQHTDTVGLSRKKDPDEWIIDIPTKDKRKRIGPGVFVRIDGKLFVLGRAPKKPKTVNVEAILGKRRK